MPCNGPSVGDTVRIRDMSQFADVVWRDASGPTDPNAHLAMDIADWWRAEPPTFTVEEVQEQPGNYPPYLMIRSPSILGGESFGVNYGTDVVLVEQAPSDALPGTERP